MASRSRPTATSSSRRTAASRSSRTSTRRYRRRSARPSLATSRCSARASTPTASRARPGASRRTWRSTPRAWRRSVRKCPMGNLIDFIAALTLYKGGTKQDADSLRGMMTSDKMDMREVDPNAMASIGEEVPYFPEEDMRKAVRANPMAAPAGWDSVEGGPTPASPDELSGSSEDASPIHVHSKGQTLRMDSTASMTGAEALKAVTRTWRDIFRGRQKEHHFDRQFDRASGRERGFTGHDSTARSGLSNVLFRLTNKQLRNLVGDIQVDFVSDADMKQLSGQKIYGGIYLNPTAKERHAGVKPRILINKTVYDRLSPAMQHHVIMHEMTHAATAYALEHNIRGTAGIVTRMREALEKELIARYGEIPDNYKYGFTNDHEFIAEAFSNAAFQEMLAVIETPDRRHRRHRQDRRRRGAQGLDLVGCLRAHDIQRHRTVAPQGAADLHRAHRQGGTADDADLCRAARGQPVAHPQGWAGRPDGHGGRAASARPRRHGDRPDVDGRQRQGPRQRRQVQGRPLHAAAADHREHQAQRQGGVRAGRLRGVQGSRRAVPDVGTTPAREHQGGRQGRLRPDQAEARQRR